MIYDCCLFFNELDLLEIRFNELDQVVGRFVVIEARQTFTGIEKPLHFDENRSRFEPFLDKVIHIVVNAFPPGATPWEREAAQRNQISEILPLCEPTDTLIISDADEIPRPKAILKAMKHTGIITLEQELYYYFLNMRCTTTTFTTGAVLMQAQDFKENPNDYRHHEQLFVSNAGWHFSYLGGAESIIQKIESFSHQEFNTPEIKSAERIRAAIETGKDLFGRDDVRFERVPLDDTFPKYLVENRERFRELIL